MLDIMDIAYFNYMEEQEKKNRTNRSGIYENDISREETTQYEEYEEENIYSQNIPPYEKL